MDTRGIYVDMSAVCGLIQLDSKSGTSDTSPVCGLYFPAMISLQYL